MPVDEAHRRIDQGTGGTVCQRVSTAQKVLRQQRPDRRWARGKLGDVVESERDGRSLGKVLGVTAPPNCMPRLTQASTTDHRRGFILAQLLWSSLRFHSVTSSSSSA